MANRTKYTVSQKTKLDAAWAAALRKTGQEFTARIELLAADTGLRVPQVKVFSLYPGTKSRNDLNRKKSPFTFVFYGKLEWLSLYPGTKSRNELNRRERQRRIMLMTCIIAPVPL